MGDADLIARQDALQREAAEVLTTLGPLFQELGPPLVTGSFVSGLMVWRDLDVMVLGGPDFGPADVLALIGRALTMPGLTGFEYADERGNDGPDRRYHLALRLGQWRVDLSIWLQHDHAGVTRFHERLRDTLTPDQRMTILRIKDEWHRRPEYPDEVSGFEIYTAVLDHGIRTPAEFGDWLASRS
ncbi:MAG TPA: hypothetical protein VFH03_11530 [Actinoplanes sp.]|nr:hypothetical protein [Actinoplanes sp.]